MVYFFSVFDLLGETFWHLSSPTHLEFYFIHVIEHGQSVCLTDHVSFLLSVLIQNTILLRKAGLQLYIAGAAKSGGPSLKRNSWLGIRAVFTDVDIIKLLLHDPNFDYLEFVTGVENRCNLQASY